LSYGDGTSASPTRLDNRLIELCADASAVITTWVVRHCGEAQQRDASELAGSLGLPCRVCGRSVKVPPTWSPLLRSTGLVDAIWRASGLPAPTHQRVRKAMRCRRFRVGMTCWSSCAFLVGERFENRPMLTLTLEDRCRLHHVMGLTPATPDTSEYSTAERRTTPGITPDRNAASTTRTSGGRPGRSLPALSIAKGARAPTKVSELVLPTSTGHLEVATLFDGRTWTAEHEPTGRYKRRDHDAADREAHIHLGILPARRAASAPAVGSVMYPRTTPDRATGPSSTAAVGPMP
jgi:hypothetical protein